MAGSAGGQMAQPSAFPIPPEGISRLSLPGQPSRKIASPTPPFWLRSAHVHGISAGVPSRASPDGRSLAVGCDDNTLLFWNLATSRPTAEIPLNGGPFLLGFAQDNSALIAGTMKGCRILRAVPYHPAP